MPAAKPKPDSRDTESATARRAASAKAPRTLNLSVDLVERMQNAVYWTPGLTMAALAEVGIERELARMERKRGGAFPRREKNPSRGRPIGS